MNDLKRLNLLTSEIAGVFHDVAVSMGLSDSAMHILYTVSFQGDSCPLGDIIRLTGISKQTINSSLRKLEKDHILYLRAEGPRRKVVCLTDFGKELADRTAGQMIRMENEIFASWTETDRDAYLALTGRYLNDLKEKTKELLHESHSVI